MSEPEGSALPAWDDVLATALVGTQRRVLPDLPSTVDDPAAALLDVAAVLALHRRAGVLPSRGLSRPVAAVDDSDVPLVASSAAARVADLLAAGAGRGDIGTRDAEGRLELLAEWLGAARGRRLPGELLPPLLEIGRRHRQMRPLIAAVGGGRARWLAAQRAEWGYLIVDADAGGEPVEPADVEDWELGSIERRVAYLIQLRQRDAAAGLRLLEESWAAQPPEERATLLRALETALSTVDQGLLERALDDRRKEVRLAAIELLTALPDSDFAQRMVQRATACIQVGGGRVLVHPPSECDRQMRRDGIAIRPPVGIGERAWWLEEVLTRTPLRTWGEPGALLQVPVTDQWAAVLRRGLARAAAVQRDPAWAVALTAALTADVAAGGRPDDRLLLEALYDTLPADALTALAVDMLGRGLGNAATVGVEHVLELCPRPWPADLVDAVFVALGDFAGRRTAGWRLAGVCELAALRMPVSAAQRAADLGGSLAANDPLTTLIGRLADTLRFRHQMIEELA